MNKSCDMEYIRLSIQQYATGAIKGNKRDLSGPDNKERSRRLMAQLMFKGYEVITVNGSYIENFGTEGALEIDLAWYFVIDSKNKMILKNSLKELGGEYEQDSVLYIPKGGKEAFLIGLNTMSFPEPGIEVKTIDNDLDLEQGTLLSKLSHRPFIFKESFETLQAPENIMGKWALSLMAKSVLKK